MKRMCMPITPRMFFLLLALPILGSCREEVIDIQSEIESPTFQMKLSVGSQAVSGVQLRDMVKQFTLIVYDAQSGEELFREMQDLSSPRFGTLDLRIPHGTYQAVAIASNSSFEINRFLPSATPVKLPFDTAFMEYHQENQAPEDRMYKTSDTFMAAGVYTINASANVDLVLQRVVGKLEVAVNDADTFQLRVKNEATGISFQSASPVGIISRPSYQIATGSKERPLSFYIMQTSQPLELEIVSGGKSVAMTAPVYRNRVTVVSGNIMDSGTMSKLSATSGSSRQAFQTVIKSF